MNLLELLQAQLTDERIDRLAAIVAESGTATRRGLGGAALPAVLAGLSGEFAGEAGAARLLELMRAGGHDGSLLANLDGALAGGAHTEALLNLGKGQLGAILGDRIDAVTELMAADTGMRRTSAVSLLGLLVPVVLAVLGRQLVQGGGASRLATLLAGARPAIAPLATPGLAAALGIADLAAPVPSTGAVAARSGAVWPWLIVPACTLAMFFALRSCQQNSMRDAPAVPARAPAPAPVADPAPPGEAFPAPGSPTPALPELATPPPSSEVPFPGPQSPPPPSNERAPAATP